MPEDAIATVAPPSAGGAAPVSEPISTESPTVDTSVATESTDDSTLQSTETTESTQTDDQLSPEAKAQEAEDGRLLPKDIRDLKETNPELYRKRREEFFDHRAYKKEFPTVGEARRAKQTLDLIGGEQGIQQLQTDISEFKSVAKQYMDGDPAFVDDLAKTDPLVFGSHVPHWLDKYKEVDTEGFNREMARRIHGEHEAVDLIGHLQDAYSKIPAGAEGDAARAILNNIAKWHNSIDKLAKQEEDPRYAKLKQQLADERKNKANSENQEKTKQYHSGVFKAAQASIKKMVDPFIRERNLSDEDKTSVYSEVARRANVILSKDQDYQAQKNRLLQEGDVAKSVRHAVAAFEKAFQTAVPATLRLFGYSAPKVAPKAPASAQPAAKAPASAGFTQVKERPKVIDRAKTEQEARKLGMSAGQLIMSNRAVDGTGRKVIWP